MGYIIYLKSNEKIKSREVDEIVSKLPQKFSSPVGNSRQKWGWSTAVDLSFERDEDLCVSGSYGISGHIAEEYSLYLKEELEKLGYEIDIDYNW